MKRIPFAQSHVCAIFLLMSVASFQATAFAQSTTWFPISLPADDGYVPEDTSNWFLPRANTEPAGIHGFLTVDPQGHFRFEDGTPVRFIGMNFSAGAAFPDSAEATMMARRLAKFGVNLVRLKGLDNSWSGIHESIFQAGIDTRRLNPQQLQRLDYLIHQLSEHGIYVSIPLHSSRQFRPGDGVSQVDSLPLYGKAVSLFDPTLLALQKEYARNLLTHQNEYTGRRYADDPRIAMLEITNENSLYTAWKLDLLNGRRYYGFGLSTFYQGKLDSLWNDYLIAKYQSTDSLRRAWSPPSSGAIGPDLVRNGGFEQPLASEWILEQQGVATGSMARAGGAESGSYALGVGVSKATESIEDLQLKQVGFPVEKDSTYLLTFSVKSSQQRRLRALLVRDDDPASNLGLQKDFAVIGAGQWVGYAFSFAATASNHINARLALACSDTTGAFYLDNVRLRKFSIQGLAYTEYLRLRNVKRIEHRDRVLYSPARVRDTAEFYEKTEHNFYSEMYRYLKEDLGARALISASNIYGGPADAKAFAVADYVDHHAYWDHPFYPSTLYSHYDWTITNKPLVQNALAPDCTIPLLASKAVAGKPFSVGEYNHPFPNEFQAEALPILVAYGSLQDWDALSIYSYHQSFGNWTPTNIEDNFQSDANPVIMALLPQISFLFRHHLIRPAEREILLQYSKDDLYLYDAELTGLLGVQGYLPPTLSLQHRLRIGSFDAPRQYTVMDYGVTWPLDPYRSDTGEIEWDSRNGLLMVENSHVVMATGFLNSQPILTNSLDLLNASGFGTVLWTASDGQALENTDKSLLTVVTRAANTSQTWTGGRTQLGNWGRAPVLMEPMRVFLHFKLPVDSLAVFPLDSLGRADESHTYLPDQNGRIRVLIDQRDQHSVWFGIRHYRNTTGVRTNAPQPPVQFALSQSFPNPARINSEAAGGRQVRIKFSLPDETQVTLVLYDLNGREVRRLVDEKLALGEHSVWINVAELKAGIYFYRLQAGERRMVRKMVIIH